MESKENYFGINDIEIIVNKGPMGSSLVLEEIEKELLLDKIPEILFD
jgi:hypothetical protein